MVVSERLKDPHNGEKFKAAITWSVLSRIPLANEAEPIKNIRPCARIVGRWAFCLPAYLQPTNRTFGVASNNRRLLTLELLFLWKSLKSLPCWRTLCRKSWCLCFLFFSASIFCAFSSFSVKRASRKVCSETERMRQTLSMFADTFTAGGLTISTNGGACVFCWDISIISPTIVLKLSAAVFTSLPFWTLSPNWLNFFRSFQNNSV